MTLRCIVFLLLLLGTFLVCAQNQEKKILVVVSSNALVYEQVVQAFHRSVTENRHRYQNFPVITLTDVGTTSEFSTMDSHYDLILTIGSEAAERVLADKLDRQLIKHKQKHRGH